MSQTPAEPYSAPPRRTRIDWGSIWGQIIASLIMAGGAVAAALIAVSWVLPAQEESYPVLVEAKTYPFAPTSFTIEKGDDIQIIVQDEDDTWDCGQGPEGPEGKRGDKASDRPLDVANLCELLVSFQPNEYYRVGAYGRFTAPESGYFYLGANDATECNPSCYTDNSGTLSVRVIVAKKR